MEFSRCKIRIVWIWKFSKSENRTIYKMQSLKLEKNVYIHIRVAQILYQSKINLKSYPSKNRNDI